MKIRTITCHDVYNYGASLQAFALQHYLESQGYDVQIIDYKPQYLCTQYKFWLVPRISHFYNWTVKSKLFRLLFCCYRAPKKFATYGRVKRFKEFNRDYLKCTKRYVSYEELVNDPPQADCYVCGSDQIWNTALPNGLDPAFYCKFGSLETKRISYAASFGIHEIQSEYTETVKKLLAGLESISVREASGLRILKSLGSEGVNVVDPVLLLSKEEWENNFNLKQRPTDKPYILVYDLNNNVPQLQEAAQCLAKENGWKIVSICGLGLTAKYADIIVKDAGPVEFLSYIRNAEFVMSTSFHATAFSVLFNRPFACFYNHSNISRMKDFLEIVGLSGNLNPSTLTIHYNWTLVNKLISEAIYTSMEYLSKI